MMNTAGCDQKSAGIGNIAYVEHLVTEKIVTTKLRCSKFGYAYNRFVKFGWVCVLYRISHFFKLCIVYIVH